MTVQEAINKESDMAGIYGNTSEDRARERELNRHLDAQFRTLREEQRYQDALDDKAGEVLTDSGHLFDIYDSDPDKFMEAVATMVFNAQKPMLDMDMYRQRNDAYVDFRDTLKEMAKRLGSVQQLAENELED